MTILEETKSFLERFLVSPGAQVYSIEKILLKQKASRVFIKYPCIVSLIVNLAEVDSEKDLALGSQA